MLSNMNGTHLAFLVVALLVLSAEIGGHGLFVSGKVNDVLELANALEDKAVQVRSAVEVFKVYLSWLNQ